MPTFHLAGQSFTLNLLDFKFAKVPPLSTGGDDSVFSNPDIFAANGDASSCIIEETGCNYCISTLIGANLSTTAGYDEDLYVLGNSFMKNVRIPSFFSFFTASTTRSPLLYSGAPLRRCLGDTLGH